MDLNHKLIRAARTDGVLRDLTDRQIVQLMDRGHARWIGATGRWVLTDSGLETAQRIEAELTAAELAEVDR